MSRIFVRSNGPGDWRCLLADPETQWERRYSARTLAHCWEDTVGFPPEVKRVLSQHTALAKAEPILIFPEWRVSLPGGTRQSQNDVWVLASTEQSSVSIAVEGKVNEPFDKTLAEWKVDASRGKETRLEFLTNELGLKAPLPDHLRYQLLHRTASSLIEARRFRAQHAVMLVHSFSHDNQWFDDFANLAGLFGPRPAVDQLVTISRADGISLHLAWVHGDERFLDA